jgi:hypothetical protein
MHNTANKTQFQILGLLVDLAVELDPGNWTKAGDEVSEVTHTIVGVMPIVEGASVMVETMLLQGAAVWLGSQSEVERF